MSTPSPASHDGSKASIVVIVTDQGGTHAPVAGAWIGLHQVDNFEATNGSDFEFGPDACPQHVKRTDAQGRAVFHDVETGKWYSAVFLNYPRTRHSDCVKVKGGHGAEIVLKPKIDASVRTQVVSDDCKPLDCRQPRVNDNLVLSVTHGVREHATVVAPGELRRLPTDDAITDFGWTATEPGHKEFALRLLLDPLPRMFKASASNGPGESHDKAEVLLNEKLQIASAPVVPVTGKLGISLSRSETESTEDLPLWIAIRNGTEALSFNNYLSFVDMLFCDDQQGGRGGFGPERNAYNKLKHKRFLPFTDTDAYRVLKAATEAFVMVNCAVLESPGFGRHDNNGYLDRRGLPTFANGGRGFEDAFERYLEPIGKFDRQRILPYLALVRRKLPDIPVRDFDHDEDNLCVGFVQDKLANPCMVELIWSYWLEEAMLVQTMNAVTRRFQNLGSPVTPDPLANLEIDPLRPLNNLIWGYTQDEQHRLTVNRRNNEYDHAYGLRLQGRAVRAVRPADSRSQFLEAFHHLLRLCTVFFKQDDDTTVKADAFPVLNALKEVHLVMSQGAHNQFGDLPSTARIEMLMQQWLLARPEFREFLPTRIMVAYPEPWMDRVDAMKKIQGWTDTSVVHFRNLAIFGEQLLLGIRYGAWSEVYEPTQAFNWARFWRPQIQGYNHAYRAATGVELSGQTSDVAADATLPSLLLQKRLAAQQRSA